MVTSREIIPPKNVQDTMIIVGDKPPKEPPNDLVPNKRHAYALGFIPVIISDAVSSYNKEAHERSLANMRQFFPVITAKELTNYWA